MSWLFRHNWAWSLAAFLLGALITWLLLDRRKPAPAQEPAEAPAEEPVKEEAEVKEEALVGATVTPAPAARTTPEPAVVATPEAEPAAPEPEPAPAAESEPVAASEPVAPTPPAPEPPVVAEPEAVVPASRLMDSGSSSEPTLFDDEVPVGRFGPGSADAVPHQGPPDGFTIKGNAQSMLFHTPDSPYYGRTKAEVWFRTEADAERSGFTKYLRKPRKSTQPGN